MRHLEVLVEERSAVDLLSVLIPRIVGDAVTWSIRDFSGKPDLLRKLPNRLTAYAAMAKSTDLRVVVLVDRDSDDCVQLKAQLELAACEAGLPTKSVSSEFVVVNRIAVEEIEAWFFGDAAALRGLYPKLPTDLAKKAKYRDPDSITGGTWETLEQLLRTYGYERGGLRKTVLAKNIAPLLDLERNRSVSFRQFVTGLEAAVA